MKSAVLVFPGSNCDLDMFKAVRDITGETVDYVWHSERSLAGYDAIFLPGGFSYGDYLRSGAIASFAPVMEEVAIAAQAGKLVMGVCNGFQILVEAGLLPGALRRNRELKFICRFTDLRVENNDNPFLSEYEIGDIVSIPIAHGEGNYYCDEETLQELIANQQIVFTYQDNPNGSLHNIAGIINKQGNVLGMMPHPERAVHTLLGSEDGKKMFISILNSWRKKS